MAINLKGLLSNPMAAYQSAREPGGLLAPVTSMNQFLGDPRVNIGLAIASGQPIGKAIMSGALQANTLQETFAKQNLQKKIADGTATKQDYIGLYPELAAKSLFSDPEETFTLLNDADKQKRGLDPKESYQIGDISGKVSQIGAGTKIDLGGKKEIEFAKSQIGIVEGDIKKSSGFIQKGQAINQIEAGLSKFKSGAFSGTREFVGSVGKFFGAETLGENKYFNASGAELIGSGSQLFNRILADGLVNLNTQELKMLQDTNTKKGNTPYTNNALVATMKINNKVDRQINELGKDYIAENISFDTYNKQIKQLKIDATKEANELFKNVKSLNQKIPEIIKNNVGANVKGYDVTGNIADVQVANTDKWTGQTDTEGRQIMVTLDGTQYTLTVEDTD
tara:strand:+ start:770 stop:1951 length:1182 start_codon:yes stop_codon:yes gene_type:complete